MSGSAESICPHENFHCSNVVSKVIGEKSTWLLSTRVKCSDCNKEFRFLGLPIGLENISRSACVNWTGTEARARITP
jgi:hypothetical protein